jgi:RNA polymerase sigma-70 factor (ECF subfamily)
VAEPEPATVRAAARGDLAAFEELVRGHQAQVWRFLCRMVADSRLAEDLAQETFLRAHRRLGTFRYDAKFSTWLYQIARNVAIDALRSRERRLRLTSALRPPGAHADPSAAYELRAAVDSLPTRLREAFVLVEMVGLTYREAAIVVGSPAGTMKSRVFRARGQLVAWLETDETAAGEGTA